MGSLPPPHPTSSALTSYYWSGDSLRSRSVGARVLTGQIALPALPARLLADCERETLRLGLEAGDVEPLSLARARTRWPDYRTVLQAMADWAASLGLQQVLAASEPSLMACRGARYHHDGAHYGGVAFCNLFLGEDRGLDVHFPSTGQRIALTRGTAMLFDTGQPHAVIPRQRSGFDAADFGPEQDCSQFFLSWELPVEDAQVTHALGLVFDVDPLHSVQLDAEQVWLQGAPAALCPHTGRWLRPAASA